jgi:hypothetical protein
MATLAVILLLALGASACGDDDEPTTTTPATAEENRTKEPSPDREGEKPARSKDRDGQGSPKSNDSGKSAPSANAAPVRVSGGGSGQFRTPGGDNSIQDFGEESDESELRAAARVLHGFLVARAEENWPEACSYLAQAILGQLDQLAARSTRLKGQDCAGVLGGISPPLSAAARRELTVVNAGSLRQEGERGFLIYYGAGKAVYAIPMANEGGEWKVGGLTSLPLS